MEVRRNTYTPSFQALKIKNPTKWPKEVLAGLNNSLTIKEFAEKYDITAAYSASKPLNNYFKNKVSMTFKKIGGGLFSKQERLGVEAMGKGSEKTANFNMGRKLGMLMPWEIEAKLSKPVNMLKKNSAKEFFNRVKNAISYIKTGEMKK